MRTILLGFDAFDPVMFERLYEQRRMPNLGRLLENMGYSRFQVTNPPQSEVSWTSIATGLNPGEHGIFDFVHRDPKSYTPYVSILPTAKRLGATQFVRPFHATTIFDQAAQQGYPATALWWPVSFPARRDSPVRTIPGLGTPDINGRLGVGYLFTSDSSTGMKQGKTPVFHLKENDSGIYRQNLPGPARKTRQGIDLVELPLEIQAKDETSAKIRLGSKIFELPLGRWSPILELEFRLSRFVRLHFVTRAILTQLKPVISLYLLPLQIHPLHSVWPYASPASFVKGLWKSQGPFLTIGWPQDTTGLEDGCLDDKQFLALCQAIFEKRAQILMHQLEGFQEGILASVFDTLDRIQHMFWHSRPDIVESWYAKLDDLVGQVQNRLDTMKGEKPRLLLVSDHGFTDFEHKVHLNRWLIDQGYLVSTDREENETLKDVDWRKTEAYALGLNSIYLNVSGREGQGQLTPEEIQGVQEQIKTKLLQWTGPDHKRVVQEVWTNQEAFSGILSDYGPDLVVGYAPGYRASQQTGMGGWGRNSLEPNPDHWGADHCIDQNAVPGVLFSSQSLEGYPHPSYADIPSLAIDSEPCKNSSDNTPHTGGGLSDEEQQALEERLKTLGYL